MKKKTAPQNTPLKCSNVPSGYSKKSAHSTLPTGLTSRRLRPSGLGMTRLGTTSIRTHKTSATIAQQAQDACIKALERENYELKRSNEILRKAAAFLPRRSPAANSRIYAGK